MRPAGTVGRIHIVGGPGSGKSTLGRFLGRPLGTEAWDLDVLALSEGVSDDFRPRRSLAARRHDIAELSRRDAWITEGSFLWWTEPLFERADLIIWLDPPWHVAALRILTRHVGTYLTDVRRAGTLRRRLRALRHPHVHFLVRFVRWSAHYYNATGPLSVPFDPDDMDALTRSATQHQLSAYTGKVIHLKRADTRNLEAALARMGAGQAALGHTGSRAQGERRVNG